MKYNQILAKRQQDSLVASVQADLDSRGIDSHVFASGPTIIASVEGQPDFNEVVVYKDSATYRLAPIRTIFRRQKEN